MGKGKGEVKEWSVPVKKGDPFYGFRTTNSNDSLKIFLKLKKKFNFKTKLFKNSFTILTFKKKNLLKNFFYFDKLTKFISLK